MIGRTVSHYRILEKLGEGGMGVVYKAEDTRLKRTVALKFLPSALTSDPEAKQRFIHEAQAASSLDHPNICTVYDIGEEEDGQMFIAMACYDGETLKKKIERGPLKISEALDFTIQVSQGLAKAHEHGIIHRDIKPANIIITSDGVAKILDFGLAKLSGRTILTRAGSTLGTAPYLSPEQAKGDIADHRTDIWSLGVVMYEMLTGRLPFRGEFDQAIVYQILNDEAELLTNLRSDVPVQLDRIVKKAMRKDQRERYQSVQELALDLRMLQDEVEKHGPGSHRGKVGFPGKSHAFVYGGTVALLVLLAVAVYFWPAAREKDVPVFPDGQRIAVLPFENISPDSQDEFFADGMTDELIATLSKIGGLRVIARTSVMRFKGTRKDVAEIGNELKVNNVLEGSVRKAGNKLRITAQLIDVQTQEHLWTQEYDRELQDVFAIQSSIAHQVAEALKLHLLTAEMQRIEKVATKNLEAYTLYLKGRYFWNTFTRDGLLTGIEYFKKALEKDKDYALAYSGIADCYGVLGVNYLSPKETMPKAKAAAEKALRIDDMLAEPHTSLAAYTIFYEWDWVGAERMLQRAIELNPNYANAHQLHAYALELMERHEEALAEIMRAQELDPLSLVINIDIGVRYYFERQYDKAIDQYQKTLEMDPNLVVTHRWLALAYEQTMRSAEAIAELERVMILSGEPARAAELRHAYADSGYDGVLRQQLRDSTKTLTRPYFTAYDIAATYAHLGEKIKAIEWLERAYEERFPLMPWLKLDPRVDALRSDPDFAALLKKMGLQK